MDQLSNADHLSCELMVNGRSFHSVQIRQLEWLDDFDVLITDRTCGSFGIHDGFDLSLREGSTWRPATLGDLKKRLREEREFPSVLDVTRHDRCVRRVKAVLREAAIPYVPCGAVFVVPDRAQANRTLLRAGFQPSRISSGALLEPFSGSAVYLLEREGTFNRGGRTK